MARLVPIKAIDVFLKAAVQVLAAQPNAHFVVAGDGDLRADMEQLAQSLGIAERVHFLGFRADLPRINADLSAKVLCSLNEGLPVAVIEALAACRPVVATDVGSVKDLVVNEETGILVPSGDVQALTNGIVRVLENPERAQKWGENGRARVYPQLDISRLVNDIEALYLEVAREKNLLPEKEPLAKA